MYFYAVRSTFEDTLNVRYQLKRTVNMFVNKNFKEELFELSFDDE